MKVCRVRETDVRCLLWVAYRMASQQMIQWCCSRKVTGVGAVELMMEPDPGGLWYRNRTRPH